MAVKTFGVPHRTEDTFDEKDRTEIHRIIIELRHNYLERHTEALTAQPLWQHLYQQLSTSIQQTAAAAARNNREGERL